MSCELSIILPAYQEAPHLAGSLGIIVEHARAITNDLELIVVDDGSRDETWSIIVALKDTIPELRGLRLSRNFGKEQAVLAGLECALGRAVVIMDADLQHPPALLHTFYGIWKAGRAQVVEGVKRRRPCESAWRRAASTLFNRLLTLLAGFDFHGSTDFKLLDRCVVDALLRLPERRGFFRGMVSWVGFHHTQVAFDVEPRASGSSQWSMFSLLRLAGRAIVSYSAAPLRLIHIAAACFLILAIGLAVRAMYLYITQQAIGGFTTVILLLLVLGAMVLFSLGVIAEYLAALYEEIKGRPRYFIARRTEDGVVNADDALPAQVQMLAGALNGSKPDTEPASLPASPPRVAIRVARENS